MTDVWSDPGKFLEGCPPIQRFKCSVIHDVDDITHSQVPELCGQSKSVHQLVGVCFDVPILALTKVHVLVVCLALPIIYAHDAQYVLDLLANLGFSPVADEDIHCTSFADVVFECSRKRRVSLT